jgi:hypothetical protein
MGHAREVKPLAATMPGAQCFSIAKETSAASYTPLLSLLLSVIEQWCAHHRSRHDASTSCF